MWLGTPFPLELANLNATGGDDPQYAELKLGYSADNQRYFYIVHKAPSRDKKSAWYITRTFFPMGKQKSDDLSLQWYYKQFEMGKQKSPSGLPLGLF